MKNMTYDSTSGWMITSKAKINVFWNFLLCILMSLGTHSHNRNIFTNVDFTLPWKYLVCMTPRNCIFPGFLSTVKMLSAPQPETETQTSRLNAQHARTFKWTWKIQNQDNQELDICLVTLLSLTFSFNFK